MMIFFLDPNCGLGITSLYYKYKSHKYLDLNLNLHLFNLEQNKLSEIKAYHLFNGKSDFFNYHLIFFSAFLDNAQETRKYKYI